MRPRLLTLISLLWLLAHAGIVAQVRGTGVLIVTVTDDQDRPIPRASVNLFSRSSINGTTNEQGRIEFTELGEDPFTVNVFKRGYVPAAYGQRLSLDYAIELWPAEHLPIHVRLARAATLAGAVTTDRGEPASEAIVTARRWQVEDGRRILDDGETTGADQYGRFRFYDLEPGLYVVTAEVASPWRDEGVQVQRTGARDATIVRTDLFASIPPTLTSAAPDGLRLAAGQELGGVQITLAARTIRTATIEGTLVIPYGMDEQDAPKLVRLDDAPVLSDRDRDPIDGSLDGDGHFTFRNVTPGRYRLIARWSKPDDERLAVRELEVAGEPIFGLTLVPGSSNAVSGRLVVLDAEGAPPDLSKLVARIVDVETHDVFASRFGFSVDSDGRFRFASAPAGRYRFSDHIYGLMQNQFVRDFQVSALVNGLDRVDYPFEVAPGQDLTNVVLTLTTTRSTISGLVLGPDGKPAPDALVIAFPTDRRYWLPNSRRVAMDVPNSRGHYQLSGLPAGEYLVGVYLDAPAEGEWDSALLDAMVPCAVKVTIAPGEKRALDLRVIGKSPLQSRLMDEPSMTGVDAEPGLPAPPPIHGPAGYALAAVHIAQLDTEAIVRVSRDPSALAYGMIVVGIVSVASVLVTTVLAARSVPNPLVVGAAVLFSLLASAVTTGLMHLAAKVLFGATGSYVGLLRVLWLGSIVSLLILVPFAGPIVGGLWSLLITMVTFQEVDGIERLQALALSIGLSAGVYVLGMLVARGH